MRRALLGLLVVALVAVAGTIQTTTVTVTNAGTRVQVSTTPVWATLVILQADPNNTGQIYVGGSNVSSSNGIVLQPLDGLTITPAQGRRVDLREIWVDASTNNQSVRVMWRVE